MSLKDKVLGAKADQDAGPQPEAGPVRPKSGMAEAIAGETKSFRSDLTPFLPSELIGGSIPQIPGMEEEAVWNAAAQASGTERVHYCYSVEGGRCWYLAIPSTALASNPDSWCPLAAALPGNSEFWDRQTVYLYEQEGMASALRWDPETGRMQVFIGAARTLLPRIQSMDANFVTINPDVATIVPWKNRALRTELLARSTARTLLLSGLSVCFLCIFLIMVQYAWTALLQRDLVSVRDASEKASNDLMINAYNALQSDTIKHMVKIQQLLDTLRTIEGTLVKYEVKGSSASWDALVPKSFTQGVGPVKGTIQPGMEADGRVRLKGN
ncbi:MAG: hypothetical protein JWO78_1147 [Micavibrio sp.]|nr:hypothetical protein [Micavibrio sp.]